MNLNATLIIEIASFIILWIILAKFLFRPTLKLLDERKDSVKSWLDEAKHDKDGAQDLLEQAKQELASAKEEALDIKESVRIESEKMHKRILEEAKQESKDLIGQSQEEIDLKIKEAKNELKKDIADISLGLTEKILEREIDEKDHQRLIEESIKEVGSD